MRYESRTAGEVGGPFETELGGITEVHCTPARRRLVAPLGGSPHVTDRSMRDIALRRVFWVPVLDGRA